MNYCTTCVDIAARVDIPLGVDAHSEQVDAFGCLIWFRGLDGYAV